MHHDNSTVLPNAESEHDALMDRFMLYGGRTMSKTEAAVTYLGNSYLVKYNPGESHPNDACAAICQAFIDGATWHEKKTEQPKDAATEPSEIKTLIGALRSSALGIHHEGTMPSSVILDRAADTIEELGAALGIAVRRNTDAVRQTQQARRKPMSANAEQIEQRVRDVAEGVIDFENNPSDDPAFIREIAQWMLTGDHEPLRTTEQALRPTNEDASLLQDACDLAAETLRENTIPGEEAQTEALIADTEAALKRVLGDAYEESADA